MKTIKKGDKVLRVTDNKAYDMVNNEGYSYCPKRILKEAKRILKEAK